MATKNQENPDIRQEIPEIGVIGLSHKTTPVEMRECFSLTKDQMSEQMARIHAEGVLESVCVSTCNRVEVYFAAHDVSRAVNAIIGMFESHTGFSRDRFEKHLYRKYSRDAIVHTHLVAASLDSMVVGEDEILGQMKDAYRKAAAEKRTGQVLNRLFHHSFKTAKRVRTETEIARNPLSVAYIATELAQRVFEDISERKALLIGAGEMGELILKYLTKYHIGEIYLANRSFHNAERIAGEINREAHIITLDEIADYAGQADIIISSVSVPEYIINAAMGRGAVSERSGQPLFMIDISIPRSLDPALGDIDNIFLYNVDDLQAVADENLKNRLREVEMAKRLIDADVDEFYAWYEGLVIVPAIVSIQDTFDEIRNRELVRYRGRKLKNLSDEEFSLVEELTRQIMTKTLHNPIMYLRNLDVSNVKDREQVIDSVMMVEKLFRRTH